MEQKIIRAASVSVTLFTILICVSLQFLPTLEARAQQYAAAQMQQSREQQQREEMWATLSALEFLDYSTQQAMATADGASGDDGTSEGLNFSQQLRLEMPKGVSEDDVTIENEYVTRTVRIEIPHAGVDYLVQYPMLGKSDHIVDLDYDCDEGVGILELSMEHVYELSLDWENQYLYIDFVAPRDLYDHIVVIDAGHGGNMPGAIVGDAQEKNIDLDIVKELKQLFDEAGDETLGVYYTRLDDSNPAFADRSGLANDTQANLFISIHNNSFTKDTTIHGTTVLFDEEKPAEGNSSRHLANLLLEQVVSGLGSNNKGLVKGHDIYVIRTSEAPAALVEVGFMTNAKELANLQSSSYQKKCARAIYDGIMQALEEGY